jgi:hypothetical protein
MNDQQVDGKHNGNGENRPRDGESFVLSTLLDYAAPRATYVRGPIRLLHIVGDSPSYGASIINNF